MAIVLCGRSMEVKVKWKLLCIAGYGSDVLAVALNRRHMRVVVYVMANALYGRPMGVVV